MPVSDGRSVLGRAFGRGYFPHQLSWLIDNPLRRVIISPAQFADRLPLTQYSRVLELGPGSGYFSIELARRIPLGRLELLELQPEMLAKARRKLERHGFRNIGYTTADASASLPYREHSFDVAAMVAVLGEIPDQQVCLTNLFRVLRPGAVLAIHEHVPDPDRIECPALRLLVESAGYRLRDCWGRAWNFTAIFERP